MSTPTLREAAQALLEQWDTGGVIGAAMRELRTAYDAPPPAVPEMRRVIGRLLERHTQALAAGSLKDQHVQQQEMARLIEEMVSLWERS